MKAAPDKKTSAALVRPAAPVRSPQGTSAPPTTTETAGPEASGPEAAGPGRDPAGAGALPAGMAPRQLRLLQSRAGNAAVARLVAQRLAEAPAAPVRPPPSASPAFTGLTGEVEAKKAAVAQHPPAAKESKAAQDAALAPPDDKQAQGKAAQAEKMNAAKPGVFDKAGFIAAVNQAITAQAPKNLDEADSFAGSGKADAVKSQVNGQVAQGKEGSAKEIESATGAAPDLSAAKDKPVTPLTPDTPPPTPGAPDPAGAVPARQPDAVTDFSGGPAQVNQQMADAEVTEDQLAKSNEPQFTGALTAKKQGEQHAATAPGEARSAEAKQHAAAKQGAAAAGAQAMAGLAATRAATGKQVDGGKSATKSADEKKRAEVTAKLQKVFDATKTDVEKTLTGLDKLVDEKFTTGEKAARDAFTADHKRRMDAYKDKRYSGFSGKLKWVKDKFAGLPEEASQLFQESRKLYVAQMQQVISAIADTIGTELGKAKDRIAKGRTELKAEVDKLPADLKKFGQEAAADFTDKFDGLEADVNAKSDQLVQDLAQKYTQALNSVDEEIKKLQEENKGLIAKAKDAVVGVIQTILELKNMLLGVLAKAASAVMKIIKDPIGFLRNLVSAVGAGLQQFIGNIGEHLKKGLIGWLLGTAAGAGLSLPAKFDLKGIIQLLASMLGLTWASIRARITRKGVPEQAMTAAEKSVPIAQTLQKEGPAGAVEHIKASVGDLKTTILQKLTSYLIPTVIVAGITWIISLLNPASAFVRAVKGIIDIVTFIVTQGAQIIALVNSVLDAVIAIAGGGQAGVPALIEGALAGSIPILIGFLAGLLGIGGLANKVKQVFTAVAKPVNKAIDKIVDFIAKKGKALWSKLKRRNSEEGKKNGKQKKSTEIRQSRDVKREARRMLSEQTATPMESENELNSIISTIESKLRPRGLKSLRAEKNGKNPDQVNVLATASPTEVVAKVSLLKPKINMYLPQHGTALAADLKTHWWKAQLKETNAWNEISVLDGFETAAIAYLKDPGTHENLKGYFDPAKNGGINRRDDASADTFRQYALHRLDPKPSHSTRAGFYERAGDGAEEKLKKGANNATTENPDLLTKLAALKFGADAQYGRFSSLPVARREVDPRLKAAAGAGRLLTFLKEMAISKSSGGLKLSELKSLWDEQGVGENPHRKWLKGEFRALADGHHEWIPTDQLIRIMESDMGRASTEISTGWIELQHELRSLTTDVIWEIRLNDTMTHVESHDMDAHVGAFMTHDGNPIYNGRDKKWHDSLRGYFKDFTKKNPDGSPAGFLAELRTLLEEGKLMWDGDTSKFSPSQRKLKLVAVYKSLLIEASRVGETAQKIQPFDVEELGSAQEAAFGRLRDKLDLLIEKFS
ncbi:hypothetical protein [Streptomyces odonnellii]|uniref:hypothetical protein n=1 Tax=Streptomyces odonnellii TaxID=1417980 RepID=UPI00069889E0|nr:hypothetical protein [Streptomyces odonnellii]